MSWFSSPHTLAYKIFQVYIQTVELYRRPNIGLLFDQKRQNKYLELLRELYALLKEVYHLELKYPRDDLDAPPIPKDWDEQA